MIIALRSGVFGIGMAEGVVGVSKDEHDLPSAFRERDRQCVSSERLFLAPY